MELKNNINDSKQLISIIQSRYPKMSKGQKLIAQYIIKNYDKVAFMTASKLGDTVGVSESTVVRFANALGYSGYPKLQDALQELIKNKLTTVQRVKMSNEDYSDDTAILSKVLKSDIDNIRGTPVSYTHLDVYKRQVSSNLMLTVPLNSFAKPKFKHILFACPICKYPFGSGGKRVII